MLLHLLERFSGYTLSSFLAEDSELLHLLELERLGRPPGGEWEGG